MEKDFPAPSVLYETQEGWEGSQGHVDTTITQGS